jgi:hypothetical protein
MFQQQVTAFPDWTSTNPAAFSLRITSAQVTLDIVKPNARLCQRSNTFRSTPGGSTRIRPCVMAIRKPSRGILEDGRSFQLHRDTHGPEVTSMKIEFK